MLTVKFDNGVIVECESFEEFNQVMAYKARMENAPASDPKTVSTETAPPAKQETEVATCSATLKSGKACGNPAKQDGLCGIHARQTSNKVADNTQEPAKLVSPLHVVAAANRLSVGESIDMKNFRFGRKSAMRQAMRKAGSLNYVQGETKTWDWTVGDKAYRVVNVNFSFAEKHGLERNRTITRVK